MPARNPFFPAPLLFNPFMLWADFAMKSMEMFMASGQVIGHRVGRMAAAGPNPSARDRSEFARMAPEKLEAATKSALAVASRMGTARLPLAMNSWQQWMRLSADAARMANAALVPVHAKATSNARRLAGGRKRRAR